MGNERKAFNESLMKILKSWDANDKDDTRYPITVELYTYNNGSPKLRICKEEPGKTQGQVNRKIISLFNPKIAKLLGEALTEAADEFEGIRL